MPWIVGPRLQRHAGARLGEDGTGVRFDRHRDDRLAPRVFDVAGHAGDGSARPHARDEDVDGAAGVVPDFGARRRLVNSRVRRILELLQENVPIRRRRRDRLRLCHRRRHPARALGQDQPGPVGREQLAALDAHGFGHRQRQRVAARGRDEGERDARVPAGGLDQLLARGQHAPLLGVPHHRGADAALHRIGGIASLDLREDGRGRAVGDAIETHERRAADGARVVDEPASYAAPVAEVDAAVGGAPVRRSAIEGGATGRRGHPRRAAPASCTGSSRCSGSPRRATGERADRARRCTRGRRHRSSRRAATAGSRPCGDLR